MTITAGFMILALSKFVPTVRFGLLIGLAMVVASLSSLILLPALVLLAKPFRAGRKQQLYCANGNLASQRRSTGAPTAVGKLQRLLRGLLREFVSALRATETTAAQAAELLARCSAAPAEAKADGGLAFWESTA